MLIGDYFKNLKQEYKDHFFSGINFNSSKIKKNDIFFAIRGSKFNGNNFINAAIAKGAKTIVSDKKFQRKERDILYIYSKNVRRSLSITAYKIFKKKPRNLIAVTGTNGKSSIANFYYQILKWNKKKVASIGTLGIKGIRSKIEILNTTLDPIELGKNLLKLKNKQIDNVILEASSHGLKQNRLDGLLFKTGIFTNLSHDHLDYHKTSRDYLKSKLYLFERLLEKKGNIITDNSIKEYKKIKSITSKKKVNLFTISNKKKGFLRLISNGYHAEKQKIEILYKNKIYELKIDLIGKIQIKNLLMAMIAAEKSNLTFVNIIKAAKNIKPVYGRLEKIGRLKNNALVILDYAHTPDALKTCISNLKEQFNNRKISIVFGCGGNRDKEKRSVMGKIVNSLCDSVFLTDDNPRNENPKKIRLDIKRYINKNHLYEIPNRAKAIDVAIKKLKTGEVLLVAGKGHEEIQDYGSKKNFLSDKEIITNCIKSKNRFLSKNIKTNILNEQIKSKNKIKKLNIKKVSINSKTIKKNDIFFAIKGKKNDGNLYVKEVLKKKASLAIVSKIDRKLDLTKQIKVKNPLKLLTKCSSILRENLSSKIIAITGSCGKTSLKELLGKTLKKFSNSSYSPKSFNNKFGVPLSLFNLNYNDEFSILEIGMDKKGEIDTLSKIIKPDVGVITNISHAHAKNFKNIAQIANAKAEIMNNIRDGGTIILNADDKFFEYHQRIALRKNLKVYSFGFKNKKSNIKLNNIVKKDKKFIINLSINSKKTYFYLPNNYENNIKNLLAALAIINLFIDIKYLNKNIFYDFKTPTGRGDVSKLKINDKNIFFVDESYNSNPLSLNSAIKNFDKIKVKNSKKYLILGDMLELGKHSKKLHLPISKIINQTSINKVSVIGKYILDVYKDIHKSKKGSIIKKTSHIINLIKNDLNNNDYIMIKGSNSTGLNKIANALKSGKINAL
jgi:MurE/MurF fusion protein